MLSIVVDKSTERGLSNMPIRRFWTDQGTESAKAQQLLQKHGIGVISVEYRSSRAQYGPVLVTPHGSFFSIDRIQHYCSVVFKTEGLMRQTAQPN